MEIYGDTEADVAANAERVGRLLSRRRVELNPRYSNRQKFLAATGLNARLVYDLERGRRFGYRDSTIDAVEQAYWLQPGAIAQALANPAITQLAARSGRPVPPEADEEEDSRPPWMHQDPGDLPAWIDLTSIPAQEAQALTGLTLLTPDERLQVTRYIRLIMEDRQPHAPVPAEESNRSRKTG